MINKQYFAENIPSIPLNQAPTEALSLHDLRVHVEKCHIGPKKLNSIVRQNGKPIIDMNPTRKEYHPDQENHNLTRLQ